MKIVPKSDVKQQITTTLPFANLSPNQYCRPLGAASPPKDTTSKQCPKTEKGEIRHFSKNPAPRETVKMTNRHAITIAPLRFLNDF